MHHYHVFTYVSSEMIIGPPDPSLYKTSLIYTPVLHSGHPQMWFVLLEGFTIGTDDIIALSLCGFFDNPCVALPDTGTSFLTVPSSQWERVIDAITDGRTDCMIDANKNTFCLDGPSGVPNLVFHVSAKYDVVCCMLYVMLYVHDSWVYT